MNLQLAFQTFVSYLAIHRERVATHSLEGIAKSENLDKFLKVDNIGLGVIDYLTTHGLRTLSQERPVFNQFLVIRKANGFNKARPLPYLYYPCTKSEPPQLIVENYSEEAAIAGYVAAVKLPYTIAEVGHDYPEGTLVVCVTLDNERAAVGYANAVPLPYDRHSIYIHDLNMLDTDYAAMLEDASRF